MDITELAKEILKDIYKLENILLERVEEKREKEYLIFFKFPEYSKTNFPLRHVSMLQMHEAILEGLTCCSGIIFKRKIFSIDFNYRDCFAKGGNNLLYYREDIKFVKLIKCNTNVSLTFIFKSITKSKEFDKFYSAIIELEGFVKGTIECLIRTKRGKKK